MIPAVCVLGCIFVIMKYVIHLSLKPRLEHVILVQYTRHVLLVFLFNFHAMLLLRNLRHLASPAGEDALMHAKCRMHGTLADNVIKKIAGGRRPCASKT